MRVNERPCVQEELNQKLEGWWKGRRWSDGFQACQGYGGPRLRLVTICGSEGLYGRALVQTRMLEHHPDNASFSFVYKVLINARCRQ